MEDLPLQTAIEAFLRGFSTTRSFTKPFEVRQASDRVWMLSDPPGARIPTRTPEFVTHGESSPAVMDAVRRQDVERYYLCVLIDRIGDLPATVADYKACGHRFLGREPMFVLDASQRVGFQTIAVRRICTAEGAAAVAKAARSRQILPEHLVEGDSVCRLYAAFDGDTPIGRVSSIRTHEDCAWVASMFVDPMYRRKGIGRSLLSAMLDDDVRFGVRWSVLLASQAGALLYPHVGYREVGTLLIFSPLRPK